MILRCALIILFISTIFQYKFVYSSSNNNMFLKQEISIGNGGEPKTLDPQKCNDYTCINILGQLFEGLVSTDENGKIMPASAESWRISPDGKKYTFFLRNHLKWSDGSELTAFDFIYSFQRLVDPKIASERAAIFEGVLNGKDIIEGNKPITYLGVKALNKNVIEIYLSKPNPIFLEYLSTTLTYPVQARNVEKFGDAFVQPGNLVSNGYFVLNFRKVGDKVTILKNNNYWNHKKVYLNKVHFYSILSQNMEYYMYETGQLDITSKIPINQYSHIKKKYGSELINTPMAGVYSYVFNNEKTPFNNKKLRQALSIAIDRKIIAEMIVGMGEKSLYNVVPYGIKNYTQEFTTYWQKWPRIKQIEEAKRLYKEAGYSEKSPLQFNILYNTHDAHKKIASAVSSMWKEILGVNARLVNEEWSVLIDKLRHGNFEIMRMATVASIHDASDFLFSFRNGNPNNSSKYSNPKFDFYIDQAVIEMNSQKRKNFLEEANKILMDDVPTLPIYNFVSTYLLKPYIINFKRDSMNERFSLIGVYVSKNKSTIIN